MIIDINSLLISFGVFRDVSSPVDEPESPDSGAVIRSHSSDLLKKSPTDAPNKKSHFNTLRQWGRSRLRLISRSPSDCRETSKTEKAKSKSPTTVQDIDDVNIYETVTMRRRKAANNKQQDRKISHERNNSYSSSEKSIGLPISMPMSSAMSIAVKLREVSSTGRRRRVTQNTNGPVKDEPHSSSGNWSASSESGRTSIGSEITSTTAAPRSSTSAATSSNSLNVPHGPPSSIVSRRRFLNTSGSGSVTSEGTLTPDIIHDLHDDMETSSEFSCDTEGYYTSFHMDSGLKTLKEEDISLPITPLHTTNTFSTSSGNQTTSTAESEYELFGKGSTSTTTSSAGTVCTTLLAAGSDRSLVSGPTVPERKSSLSKLNKSRSSSGSSSINLERSYSNSTTGSNSDRTGTIKRNSFNKTNKMNLPLSIDIMPQIKLDCPQEPHTVIQETVVAVVHEIQSPNINTGAESPDSGHNTSSSPIDDSVSSAHGGKLSCSEMDYSESSDLEGVDRIERIRVKTTINSSRIPSMCVITPNNSDDESVKSAKNESKESQSTIKLQNTEYDNKDNSIRISSRPKLDLPPHETDLDTLVFNDEAKNYDNIYSNNKDNLQSSAADAKGNVANKNQLNNVKTKKSSIARSYKSSLLPLNNLMCRLKEVFPQKLSMKKSQPKETTSNAVYTDNGEYVTIADVRNNNQKVNINNAGGVYYSNDVVKRNLQTVLSGKLRETEYVSLNELPSNISSENVDSIPCNTHAAESSSDAFRRYGARVTLDATGKVIYSSDSLKRRKGAHTTFEPGPFVKDIETHNTDECDSTDSSKTLVAPENLSCERISARSPTPSNTTSPTSPTRNVRPMSPQLGKVIIRAPNANSKINTPTSEVVRMPPSNIVTPTNIVRPMSPRTVIKGAYVNIQDAEGISLSPTKDNSQGKIYNGKNNSRLSNCVCKSLEFNSCIYCVFKNHSNSLTHALTSNTSTSSITEQNHDSKQNFKSAEILKIFNSKSNNSSLDCGNALHRESPSSKFSAFSKVMVNLLNDGKFDGSNNMRRVKRSDSYKMANSPLMPIKKFLNVDNFNLTNKNTKSIEQIESEIAADLLRDKINYPPTVSPKLSSKLFFNSGLNNIQFKFNDELEKIEPLSLDTVSEDFDSKLSRLSLSPVNTSLYSHPRNYVNTQYDSDIDKTEEELDSESEDNPPRLSQTCSYISSPNKVTMPIDHLQHRAKILSISNHFDTEIW